MHVGMAMAHTQHRVLYSLLDLSSLFRIWSQITIAASLTVEKRRGPDYEHHHAELTWPRTKVSDAREATEMGQSASAQQAARQRQNNHDSLACST